MEKEASSRLVAAAQELLQAAGVEASSDAQKKISRDLLSFKESVDAKLNTVNQNLSTSRTHIDDKVNTIDQRISSLENKATQQTKLQNLSFAIENAKLNSFEYVILGNYNSRKQSSDLVISILFSFRQGNGWYLPEGFMVYLDEKSKKEFRDKLIDQIHCLTGVKPRVNKESDGRFAIYYS